VPADMIVSESDISKVPDAAAATGSNGSVSVVLWNDHRMVLKAFHLLEHRHIYNFALESLEHHQAMLDIRKEVAALLSPMCIHPNIMRLVRVVVDPFRRPCKLLCELADHGDLTRSVRVLV
jgi:hypothetical protein